MTLDHYWVVDTQDWIVIWNFSIYFLSLSFLFVFMVDHKP